MMVSGDGFDTLILLLYRSLREVSFTQFHDYTLNLIKPALQFDAAKWGLGIRDERGPLIVSAHLHGLPPSIADDYAREVQGLDTLADRITAQPGRTVCASWDDPELAEERYAAVRAYQRKYEIAHIMSTALAEPTLGLGHFLSLYRFDKTQPWTEEARQLKERLFPHLIEAYMLARCLHLKKKNGEELNYAIASRTLVMANVTPGFRRLILNEWPDWAGISMPPAVCAVWSGGTRAYYKGQHIVIGMEPEQEFVYLTARTRNALDVLTKRELVVARLFAQGLNYADVAKEVGISPHTVRNQIKAIYLKLDVHTKAALISRINDPL